MSFNSWLQNLHSDLASRAVKHCKLTLEPLEDRTAPAILTVTSGADNGAGTLRAAIATANGNNEVDTIQFAASVTTVDLTSAELLVTAPKLTTIIGNGVTVRRNVDSAPFFRLFNFTSASQSSVSGLTISNGSSSSGSGVFNAGTLTITNSTISHNDFKDGSGAVGGIYNALTGALTITNSTISRNDSSITMFSTSGGGIVNFGTLLITHSTISGNGASTGGGIANAAGTLTIENSTISGNYDIGGSGGGGIYNSAILIITNSTISGNGAISFNGGGIYNTATLTITNSTISTNQAQLDGGGIYNTGTFTSINCTIANNRADSDGNNSGIGGGISGTFLGAIETLRNTIITGNFKGTGTTLQNIAGAVPETVTNCLANPDAGNVVPNGVNGNITTDNPLLGPLANNGGLTKTHALGQNSPAIGAASGTAPGFIGYDQRDAFRDPGAPDIGAYEVQHPLSPVGTPSTYDRTFLPKPSADANTAFVKGLYHSTLLRDPDSAGLSSWVAELNGGASRQNVTYGFINSVENRTAQVNFFYKYFLGRGPDPAGLANWVSTLQSGVDEGTVMSGFLLSPEFTGQNDNASFVNLMYYAILGRQAETAGFANWKSQLDNGTLTRDQVGNGFLRSVESITRVVTSYFGSYLKRTIDSNTAAPYVAQSQAGVTFGRIAANILGSDEFFVAAGQNLT